uniref:DUF1559 domain-containing protein n=1 Tax=Bursaphelenchus xylophilus TaxID=6326 RepID=A0A1I7RJJ5_BURXY
MFFRAGPSRSWITNGKTVFDRPEAGIHQTGHAMQMPDGNDGGNDLFRFDAINPTLSSNRRLGSAQETAVLWS